MCVIDVALALIWRDGRILISRRRSDQHLGDLWEFPGGKLEPGETPEQCAVREALEEVGVSCRAHSLLPEIVHTYPERTVRLVPVKCLYLEGEARPLAVREVRWVLPEDLTEFAFPEANRAVLETLATVTRLGRGAGDG